MLSMIVVDLLGRLYALRQRPLSIVETGTAYMRTRWPVNLPQENRSTVAIAEWMAVNSYGHSFHSIDQDLGHINVCKEVLIEKGLRHLVHFYHGNGEEVIRGLPFYIDFALLDAGGGKFRADDTLEECKAVVRRFSGRGGIVVVDDAYQPSELNKARLLWPDLEEHGIMCRGFGGVCMVAAFGPEAEAVVKGAPCET